MEMLLCKDCHTEKPLTDFYPPRSRGAGKYPNRKPPRPQQPCKPCAAVCSKRNLARRKAKDPQRVQAQNKARRARYRARHPEKIKKYTYKRYHANPDAHRLYKKEYNQRPQTKKVNILTSGRRRARKRELPNTFAQTDYDFMMQYWHFSCAVCGRENGFQWTIAADHWIALKDPACPGTVVTNILPLCHGVGGCNNSKSNKSPSLWLLERYGKTKAKKIETAIMAYFSRAQERAA